MVLRGAIGGVHGQREREILGKIWDIEGALYAYADGGAYVAYDGRRTMILSAGRERMAAFTIQELQRPKYWSASMPSQDYQPRYQDNKAISTRYSLHF